MEAIGSVGLAASLLQFIEFASKLVANISELCKSNDGLLDENREIETATNDLILQNAKIKEAAGFTSDEALNQLSESCKATTDEMIAALGRLKIHGSHSKRKIVRKGLHAVWCKGNISQLEARLSRFRNELNLHILVDLRKEILQLNLRASNQVERLDITARYLHEALVEKRDIFKFVNDSLMEQSSRIESSQGEITSRVIDEHQSTRHEILEGVRAELAESHRVKAEIQESRRSSAPNCWLVPLPKNDHFVGRISEIEYLEARLFQKNQCSRTAVMGLGGIGKTQVVLELAYRIRDRFPDHSIFWIPALSFESVRQAYFGIARHLGIAQAGYEVEDIWGLVQDHLSRSNVRPWLLIIDNADDLEMFLDGAGNHVKFSRLTDILPKSNGSSLILTTRSRKVAIRFAKDNIIPLSELDENIAIDLLNQSVINKTILEDNQAVMQLLKELTFLPLAIVQAVAYINENNITLGRYTNLLQSQEEDIIEILSEDFEDEGRYCDLKNPIATTWRVSFEKIRTLEPLAADYLSFMSCLDPKAIPESLLPIAPTKKKGIDAFGLLSAYSFISQRPADSSFDLHRLVHLATRNWLREQGTLSEWNKKVIKRLAEMFPDGIEENRALWRSYVIHVHHIQASAEFQDNIRDFLPFLRRYDKCLLREGRWAAAEATLKQQVKVAKSVYGKEHQFTLSCKADLALTRGRKGHLEEATSRLVKVIVVQERVLGSGHIDVLTTVGNLAIFYSNMGLYEKAKELSTKILNKCRPIMGNENPYILEIEHNLAVVYSLQGWFERSKLLHYQILEKRKTVLGLEHPRTLQSMSSLCYIYINQGLMTKAIDIGLQVLSMKQSVLGQEHPDILIDTQNLAVAHDFLGQQYKALKYGESLVGLSSRTIGGRHPSTLRSLSILAIIYVGMGKWDKSEKLLNKARKGLEKLAGTDHPDTMGAIFGLVAQYSMQDRLDEAEKLAVPLLEANRRSIGPEHPRTLVVMNELANIWKRQGRERNANKMKETCLRLKQRILGAEHHLTMGCFNDFKGWREGSFGDERSELSRVSCTRHSDEHPAPEAQLTVAQCSDSYLGALTRTRHCINPQKRQASQTSFADDMMSLESPYEQPTALSIASKRVKRRPHSTWKKESSEEQDYQAYLSPSKSRGLLSIPDQHLENRVKLQAQSPKQIDDLLKAQQLNHNAQNLDGSASSAESKRIQRLLRDELEPEDYLHWPLSEPSSGSASTLSPLLPENADAWVSPSAYPLLQQAGDQGRPPDISYGSTDFTPSLCISDSQPLSFEGKTCSIEKGELLQRQGSYPLSAAPPRQDIAQVQQGPQPLLYDLLNPYPQVQAEELKITKKVRRPYSAPHRSALAYCCYNGSSKITIIFGPSKF